MFKRIKLLLDNRKENHKVNQLAKDFPNCFIKIERKPFYKIRLFFQAMLWLFGINWHNSIDDECTLDFGCCLKK